jgi:hypothetical protein
MLEDHANTQASGSHGACDFNRLAPPENLACGGLNNTVDHFHQGGLSRTILTKHGMNLTCGNAEAYLVIRLKARIDFTKFLKLKNGGR